MRMLSPTWTLPSRWVPALLVAAAASCQDASVAPPAEVAVVEVSPAGLVVRIDSTARLQAAARDAQGGALPDPRLAWSSASAAVARVDATGVVTGVSPGTTTITATAGGKSGSATVQVAASAGGAYNEPAGFTRLTDRRFDTKAQSRNDAGDPATCVGGSECWDPVESLDPWTIVEMADAPGPGLRVAQQRYRAGMAGGTAPQGLAQVAWPIGRGYRALYHRFWMKLSENFDGHVTGTNKIWHLWAEPRNIVFYSAEGSDLNNLRFFINLQGVPEPDTYEYRYNGPNVAPRTPIVRGRWHLFEVLLTLNTPGQKNGAIRAWQDGVLTHEYGGRELLAATVAQPYWWQVQWSPTWGGLGDRLVTDQYMWIDQVYVSGGR